MKCLDFDGAFAAYAEKWVSENRAKYKNIDALEAMMPEVYIRWLNAPADFLNGGTPGEWFHQYDDADLLTQALVDYHEQGINVPDQLMERIVDLGERSVDALMQLVREQEEDCLRVMALNLLMEIGSEKPIGMLLDIISNAQQQYELADVAAEYLTNLGRKVVPLVLERFENASSAAKEAFLDILCNFPGEERIYTYTVDAFRRQSEKRALYASFLNKLGDERAIAPLKEALALTDLTYLDYIEIVNAVEALGGEVETTREFSGDPYYESLKEMK